MAEDRVELRRVAEASFRKSQDECQDSPDAMMRAVRAVMAAAPTMGETDAFALVWSIWPADNR